ncbi:hypothetical protein D3C79_1063380 [compost metagenome]
MIELSGWLYPSLLLAVHAERMLAQVARTGLLPPVSVAALCAAPALLWWLVLSSDGAWWLVRARPYRHGVPSR